MSNTHRLGRRSGTPFTPLLAPLGKAITAARIPPAIAVTPDGTTACIASDGLAPVTPVRVVAIAGHR